MRDAAATGDLFRHSTHRRGRAVTSQEPIADEALARLVLERLHGITRPTPAYVTAALAQMRRDRVGALWHAFGAAAGETAPRPGLHLDAAKRSYLPKHPRE